MSESGGELLVSCPCQFCHGKKVSLYTRREHSKRFSSVVSGCEAKRGKVSPPVAMVKKC